MMGFIIPVRILYSESLCKTLGVNPAHMPELVRSTDVVGGLREQQAAELGLKAVK